MPTRGEKEERGVVVQAEVEASATNSASVLTCPSSDADRRNVETAKNKSYTSKV